MVLRKDYLERLIQWKDKDLIKIISGVYCCGKSTLLKQFQEYLLDNGIEQNQIIFINFKKLENENLLDYKELHTYIKSKLCKDKMTYIFLDEVQKVKDFEKAVDSLYVTENTDIYITGSNSYLLSSELATLLSGRYITISMLPLSFKEYCELKNSNSQDIFKEYLNNGGFPYISSIVNENDFINDYLEGIYNTIIIKDIADRQNRKEININNRNVVDINLLKSISKYLSSIIGSPISVRNVTNYLVSNGRKISSHTVDEYMNFLKDSFIFYPVERFDIVGKELLKTNKKWYIIDVGLRNYILPRSHYDLGFTLENIVYFELLRRNYRINIGKIGSAEVDFVARKKDYIVYIQVTADMTSEETFNREMRPLKNIKDNYSKIVLTLDNYSTGNYEGIKIINVIDWLLDKVSID